jgi:cytochrome c oxidase cbb3-type subunit 4
MFKQFFQSVTGVDVYLIISLLVFLGFFVGMAIWLLTVSKKHISQVKHIPLNDEPAKSDSQ